MQIQRINVINNNHQSQKKNKQTSFGLEYNPHLYDDLAQTAMNKLEFEPFLDQVEILAKLFGKNLRLTRQKFINPPATMNKPSYLALASENIHNSSTTILKKVEIDPKATEEELAEIQYDMYMNLANEGSKKSLTQI